MTWVWLSAPSLSSEGKVNSQPTCFIKLTFQTESTFSNSHTSLHIHPFQFFFFVLGDWFASVERVGGWGNEANLFWILWIFLKIKKKWDLPSSIQKKNISIPAPEIGKCYWHLFLLGGFIFWCVCVCFSRYKEKQS